MSRTILTGILVCLVNMNAFSEAIKSEQGHSFAPNKIPYYSRLPFQLLGNTIVIRASVDNRKGLFIVDTGSPKVILNEKYFKNKRQIVTEYYSDDLTGRRKSLSKTIIRFQAGHLERPHQDAFLMDLSRIEKSKEIEILGIIGVDFLQRFEIVLDYVRKEITLFTLNGKGERKTKNIIHGSPAKIVELRKSRHFLYLQASINNKKLKLGLDCGVEMSVFEKEAIRVFEAHFIPSHTVWIVSLHGQKSIANVGSVRQIHLANTVLEISEVIVSNLTAINQHLITHLDGLLGFGFLSRNKISINYKKRVLSVWHPSGLMSPVSN